MDTEEVVAPQDHMVDKRIVKAPKISQDRLRDMGLEWFYGTSEWDYLSEDLVVLSEAEVGAYQQAADECLDLNTNKIKEKCFKKNCESMSTDEFGDALLCI